MGYFISLTYWIPFLWIAFLGHTVQGIICGLACYFVAMAVFEKITRKP